MSDKKNINFNNFKFEPLQKTNFELPNIDDLIYRPNISDMVPDQMAETQRELQETIDSIHEAREEKEREELRRHNELVATLKTAGENGATIIIGDNAHGVQIQQNSNHSYQKFTNSETFDYNKVSEILNGIKEYTTLSQFEDTFKENSNNVKELIEDTLKEVDSMGDIGLIKKSLLVLKDITIGATGSLIATGILALLTGIGI